MRIQKKKKKKTPPGVKLVPDPDLIDQHVNFAQFAVQFFLMKPSPNAVSLVLSLRRFCGASRALGTWYLLLSHHPSSTQQGSFIGSLITSYQVSPTRDSRFDISYGQYICQAV